VPTILSACAHCGGHGASAPFAHPTNRPRDDWRNPHGQKAIRQVATKNHTRRCYGRIGRPFVSYLANESGLCTLFERPNACKVVEGEVSKDGWCKAFVLAD
jgi:hypothetical protein